MPKCPWHLPLYENNHKLGKAKTASQQCCMFQKHTVTQDMWLKFDHRFTPKEGGDMSFKSQHSFISLLHTPRPQFLPTAPHLSLRI